MHQALTLLGGLTPEDLDWLLEAGELQRLETGSVLVAEGDQPKGVWILLEGVFGLRIETFGNQEIAQLGPGEVVGEMSFLSGEVASASVVALEGGLALALGRATLEGRVASHPAFAARLYRAFALLGQRRLRDRLSHVAVWKPREGEAPSAGAAVWREIDVALGRFKDLLAQADAEALAGDGEVPEPMVGRVQEEFLRMGLVLKEQIGDDSPLPEGVRAEFGQRVQREFLPYLMLTENAERYYSKPRGYAGDFLTIEQMYENQPAGSGRLGPVLDSCFLEAPSARAVRNRRELLCNEILAELDAHPDRTVEVTSLACGPARELFDAFERIEDKARLHATLVDIDFQALAFVSDRRDRARLRKHMHLEQSNLVYLALGRQKLDLEPQDLVYSIGLVDYFEDQFVILLLNHAYELIRPGGRVILGNFHPRSPVKAIMDYILDWKLIHRTHEDMERLFAASAFGRPCSRILTEDQGINLFAEGVKVDADDRA